MTMIGKDFWAEYFKVYDVLNQFIPYQELLESIVERLDIKKGDFVLDAGCGTGNLCLKLKAKGARVVGLDMMQEALNRYKEKDPRAETVLHDLMEPLPFPDNHFDKVACNNTLYTIPVEQRTHVINELKRVLKPEGVIVISNPRKDYKILPIYIDHLKKQYESKGALSVAKVVTRMILPTIKMFYFNSKIKKENSKGLYSAVAEDEQKGLLKNVGFRDISKSLKVYAGQNMLNHAFK